MTYTSKIVFLIITFFIAVSCKEKHPTIRCYRSLDGYRVFYYDGEFHNCHKLTGIKEDSLGRFIDTDIGWLHDTLIIINVNHVNPFDTVFYANDISCKGDKCFVFTGIFNFDRWEIGLYYPYDWKGTYTFVISEAEKYLFNYAIHFLNQKAPFVYPATPKSRESSAQYISYIKFQGKKEEKEFFADMDKRVPDEYFFINDVIMTIVGNYIRPENKISDKIGCLKASDFYDNLSTKYNTGSKLMDIEDERRIIDSIFRNAHPVKMDILDSINYERKPNL